MNGFYTLINYVFCFLTSLFFFYVEGIYYKNKTVTNDLS